MSLPERYGNLVRSLLILLEGRNPYDLGHCGLVAHYTDLLAPEAGLDRGQRERAVRAAEIHTLGVQLQMEEKKTHQALPATELGLTTGREVPIHRREEEILRRVLGEVEGLDECIEVVLQRHEWWDGQGSVLGLQGEGILPEARVLAVADAYVDLATPKAHRPPQPTDVALDRIARQAGRQFDPAVVEALGRVLREEERRWGLAPRARRFERARGVHHLNLGHFHAQVGEIDWALRSYLAAEAIARAIGDVSLESEATSGLFLTHCETGDLERARATLDRMEGLAQQGEEQRLKYNLLWGLLQWHSGEGDRSMEVLASVAERARTLRDLPVLCSASILTAALALFRGGLEDPAHRRGLEGFLDLVGRYDVFDVVERFRPFTIPLLLSAQMTGTEPVLARSLLTRLGEPVHEALLESLGDLPPSRWREALRPEGPRPPDSPAAGPAPLRVRLIGGCRVEAGDRQVTEDDWPAQKPMRLFALLACRRRPLEDEVLMDLYWPESDPSNSRNSLRNAVHQIRQALKRLDVGDPARLLVRSRRAATTGLAAEYSLDTEEFREALASAARLEEAGQFEEALAAARKAAALSDGTFLPGATEGWAVAVRFEHEAARLRALLLQARCAAAVGDPEEAELACRKALKLDPLSEEGHEILLAALVRQSRLAEAMRHYEEAVARFQEEFGMVPRSLIAAYDELAFSRLGDEPGAGPKRPRAPE